MGVPYRTSVLVLVLLAVVLGVTAAPRGEKKAGLFGPLENGMKVSLTEKGGGFEIGVVPGVPLGHTIIEVGTDYLVLEDVAGVTETRVPIYAVRAVTVTRLPKGK